MAISQGRLAASLLPHVTTQEVADRLFAKAPDVGYQSVGLSVPVSTEAAESVYKKNLSKAICIASDPRTATAVLRKFTKDSRVAVRTSLAANPSTPYESVVELAAWAVRREDRGTLAHLLPRLSATDLVACIRENTDAFRSYSLGWSQTDSPIPGLYKVLLGHPELILEVAAYHLSALNMDLARAIHRGDCADVSLEALVSRFDEREKTWLLSQLLYEEPVLTRELAECVLKVVHTTDVRIDVDCQNVALAEPGALAVLARVNASGLGSAVSLGLPEPEVRSVLSLDSCTLRHFEVVVECMASGRQFSASFEKFFVEQLIGFGNELPQPFHGLLGTLRHRLPERLAEDLLRRLSFSAFSWWVTDSDSPNAPAEGQVTRLLAYPGQILISYRNGRSMPVWRSRTPVVPDREVMTLEDMLSRLLNSVRQHGAAPGASREVRELLNHCLVQELGSGQIASIVAPALEEAFGTAAEPWDMFVVLASDWAGSFSELVDSCLALTGHERGKAVAEPKTSMACRVEELTLV